jgi:hypothetical protein
MSTYRPFLSLPNPCFSSSEPLVILDTNHDWRFIQNVSLVQFNGQLSADTPISHLLSGIRIPGFMPAPHYALRKGSTLEGEHSLSNSQLSQGIYHALLCKPVYHRQRTPLRIWPSTAPYIEGVRGRLVSISCCIPGPIGSLQAIVMRELELWRDKVSWHEGCQSVQRRISVCLQIQLRIRDRIQTSVTSFTAVHSSFTHRKP